MQPDLFLPESLPAYRKHSPTSLAAAVAVAPKVRGIRLAILRALVGHAYGIDELATMIDRHILVVRPRVSELREVGYVALVKGVAVSQLGHAQALVTITQAGHAALEDAVNSLHGANANPAGERATAHLIAAAPDLLEACRLLDEAGDPLNLDALAHAFTAAREAIAKATGAV